MSIWLKLFYRKSKKNWLNLIVNIFGLTFGFAGLIIVLLYLNDEKAYNNWNPNKDTIYKVLHIMSESDIWDSSTAIEGITFKEEIPEVTSFYLSRSWYSSNLVHVNDKNIYCENILEGNENFFEFFPFKILKGSIAKFKATKNAIALSQKQATKLFGTKNAIGKSITIYEKLYTITTVYKIIGKSYFQPSIVKHYSREPRAEWGSFLANLFVKLTPNANITEVEKKMDAIFIKHSSVPSAKEEGISLKVYQEKYGLNVTIEKLKDIRLHTKASDAGPEGKGNYQLIMIMLGLSILLIVISCVNFINLSIASSTQRAKEIGVKKTLGLLKVTLTFQFLFEIVFQTLIALLLAFVLVELILPSFNEFMHKDIILLSGSILILVSAIALLVSFIIGIIPAIYMANFKSIEILKGNISHSKSGSLVRNIMLGIQFLISGFFIIGAMIMYSQISYLINKNTGFNGEQVLVVHINNNKNIYNKYLLAKKELIKHPNIEIVTSNYYIPGGGSSSSTNANYLDKSINAYSNAIDFEYLDMVGIKIVKGRGLSPKYASDTINNILINEIAAKQLGIYDNPIGKKIDLGYQKQMTIVGVVKDYFIDGLTSKINPMFMMHWNTFKWEKQNFYKIEFKIKPKDTKNTIAFIEKYWKNNIEQGYPFSYSFLDKQFAKTYEKHLKQKRLFLILTSIVILISLLGLFALATLTIQQRLKEVAIRKTLGASVKEIMFQLIKSFVKIVLISSIILIPIAYYFMQNWLENFVYRVDMPIWPYVVTPIVLLILVFTVVGIKAFNATKVDLIKYLKFE